VNIEERIGATESMVTLIGFTSRILGPTVPLLMVDVSVPLWRAIVRQRFRTAPAGSRLGLTRT